MSCVIFDEQCRKVYSLKIPVRETKKKCQCGSGVSPANACFGLTETLVDGATGILYLGVNHSKLQEQLLPVLGIGWFLEQNIWRLLPIVCRSADFEEEIQSWSVK